MTNNNRIILEGILKNKKAAIDPSSTESDFFEMFTAEQILKDYDLSYEEIVSGIVGNGGDGGVDAMYTLVNGSLVHEDPDYSGLKRSVTIDLVIIQSKSKASFQETPIERFITASQDILDLSKSTDGLRESYNSSFVDATERFRYAYNQLSDKFPTFNIRFYYASKGDKPSNNDNPIRNKVDKLKKTVNEHFPSSVFLFEFLGASELLELARRSPQTTYRLPLAETPISSSGQVGFVCLVLLRDYFDFISDDSGDLRRSMFEANVRDYQGRTAVNDDIQKSLNESYTEDFWWLNNGITVLASNASLSGKTLTIEEPQIVNGLQSSTEIFNYFKKYNTENETRNVLVRVIVPSAPESRDRIIKATNSQTAVHQASLRATDKVQRDIEQYFQNRGLFYDRRKNFYKNEGKPRRKIIAISHLAQTVMAILLQRPDTARARPSSLLKNDNDYTTVYSESYQINMYYNCVEMKSDVDEYLRSPENGFNPKDRTNLRFYIAMYTTAKLIGKDLLTHDDLARMDLARLDNSTLKSGASLVYGLYKTLGGNDQVAKGQSLVQAVKKELSR